MKKLCIAIFDVDYKGLKDVADFLGVEVEDLIREYIIYNAELLKRFKERAKVKWSSNIKLEGGK